MDINRNNYEAYLLDLLEGRLTAADQRKVSDFLLLNPDCAEGLTAIEPWILEKCKIPFPGREQLKKEFPNATSMLTETNFNLFSIARLEGDLTGRQEKDHESMVAKDGDKNREWMEWQKTKLTAAPIAFTGKDQLKKRRGLGSRVIWLSVVSSAAVITLLITLLRIDTVVTEPALVEEVSTIQPAEMNQSVFNEPVHKEPSPPITREEKVILADRPVSLSIKKNPDPPELTGIKRGAGEALEKADAVSKDTQPRPVRITSTLHSTTEFINSGRYDQIRPIEIAPASIHLSSLSFSQLAAMDLQELFDDYTEENDISIWNIANAGIRGINRITGADLSLLASRNEEGDVSGIRFKSRRFSLSTPIEDSE